MGGGDWFESLASHWHRHGRLCSLSKWHQPGWNHNSACVKPPPDTPNHIDHTTCPRQTDNKIQDVSFCRTQEMSSNWRLRKRTRRTWVFITKSLHAYNHKLRFFRGAGSRLSNQFIKVSFSHIFLALFQNASGKGGFVTKGAERIWCQRVQNKTTFFINIQTILNSCSLLLKTVVMFVQTAPFVLL